MNMNIQKVITRALGVCALLLFTLSLSISTSAAQSTGPVGQGVGSMAQGQVTGVNSPEGGGAVPGGPGFVILNSFDFKPFLESSSYLYTNTLLQYSGPDSAWYIAPVHLPQGATINQMVAYYLDNDDVYNIELNLFQCDLFSPSYPNLMASIHTSDATTGITYAVTPYISYLVINNSMYSYAVQVLLSNSLDIGLTAVRVDYTYSMSLPVAVK